MKHLHFLFFTFCFILLFSCNNDEEEVVTVPVGVLSENDYAKLMADFSLAEAAGNSNPLSLSGTKYDSAYAFDPLKDNKIPKEVYDSTVKFYSRHPKLYKKVCEEVTNVLTQMQSARLAKSDSIRRADSLAGPVFYVLLKDNGKNKEQVIKQVKELSGRSEKDAKKFVEKRKDDTLKKKITKPEAEKIKSALEKEGARVEIKKL